MKKFATKKDWQSLQGWSFLASLAQVSTLARNPGLKVVNAFGVLAYYEVMD